MARILIVQDDPTSAEFTVLVCKAAKHIVTVVGNGLEALLLLDALAFDLVLTDLNMPRMGGIVMTGLIRGSDAAYANVPIIGMTAKADRASLEAMREAGMDEVIAKPFRPQVLRAAIDTWLAPGARGVAMYRPVANRGRAQEGAGLERA